MRTRAFSYVALDPHGRRVSGVLESAELGAAHALLAERGLAPVKIAAAPLRADAGVRLSRRALAAFLSDLSLLLAAGAPLRRALATVEQQADPTVARMCRLLQADIVAGRSLEASFGAVLGRRGEIVSGLAAAGQASGDLAGALAEGGEHLEEEAALIDSLADALSYPVFVLCAGLFALLILLLFVLPTLTPLFAETSDHVPMAMRALLGLSDFLRRDVAAKAAACGLAIVGLIIAWRAGFVAAPLEKFALDGPFQTIVRGLAFGRFAALGGKLLGAGVQASDALLTASRTIGIGAARKRLAPCILRIREGVAISEALAGCEGMPPTIVRMAAIGEETGGIGALLARAGRIESARALRQLRAATQWIGPALIIALGAMIGLFMAALLSGLTSIGNAALG
jgi:type II secretory pathway component PulF